MSDTTTFELTDEEAGTAVAGLAALAASYQAQGIVPSTDEDARNVRDLANRLLIGDETGEGAEEQASLAFALAVGVAYIGLLGFLEPEPEDQPTLSKTFVPDWHNEPKPE